MVWEPPEGSLVAVAVPASRLTLSAPVMISATTKTAPTTMPAKEHRNTGSFLVLVFTTVCATVCVWAAYGLPALKGGCVAAPGVAVPEPGCACSAGACGVGSTATRGAGAVAPESSRRESISSLMDWSSFPYALNQAPLYPIASTIVPNNEYLKLNLRYAQRGFNIKTRRHHCHRAQR